MRRGSETGGEEPPGAILPSSVRSVRYSTRPAVKAVLSRSSPPSPSCGRRSLRLVTVVPRTLISFTFSLSRADASSRAPERRRLSRPAFFFFFPIRFDIGARGYTRGGAGASSTVSRTLILNGKDPSDQPLSSSFLAETPARRYEVSAIHLTAAHRTSVRARRTMGERSAAESR